MRACALSHQVVVSVVWLFRLPVTPSTSASQSRAHATPPRCPRSAATVSAHQPPNPPLPAPCPPFQAVPRPDARVVVTQPSQGIRPILPAGYGSGFETSEWGLAKAM